MMCNYYLLRLSFIGKENDVESGLGDFGVRKYDGGRFLSIDRSHSRGWEKYLAWSPYHYCGNNPINATDGNGMWLVGVHEMNLIKALSNIQGFINSGNVSNMAKLMIEGNTKVDEDQTNQYKHCMISDLDIERNGGDENKARMEAIRNAQVFIDNNLNDFVKTGNMKSLGAATHTIQDAFAPSHIGFQIYYKKWYNKHLNSPHLVGDFVNGLVSASAYDNAASSVLEFVKDALAKRQNFLKQEKEKK